MSSSHLLPSICLFPVPSLRESCFPCYCCPLTCFACLSTCQEELLLSLPGSVCLLYPTALYILLVSSVFRPCFADTSTREGARTPGFHQSVSLCIPFQSHACFLEHPSGVGAVPFRVPGPECPGSSVPHVSTANQAKYPCRGSQARNPLR